MSAAIETRHVLHARESVDMVKFRSQTRECVVMKVDDNWLTVYLDEAGATELLEQLQRALADVKSQRFDRERKGEN